MKNGLKSSDDADDDDSNDFCLCVCLCHLGEMGSGMMHISIECGKSGS